VSAGWLLLGLLAIAFIGSSVARGRGVAGFGLPSGSEWLLSGMLVGPQLFALAGPNELRPFAPLIAAGSGFVAVTVGQRFSLLISPRIIDSYPPNRGIRIGMVGAVLTTAIVALVAYLFLGRFLSLPNRLRLGSAWALGVAFSASTRQLIDWARERLGARGKVIDFLEARVSGAELIAFLGIAPTTTLLSPMEVSVTAFAFRSVFPVIVGLILGKLALLLLSQTKEHSEMWGILLGAFFLTTGLCLRLGSSVMTAGYVFGYVLGRDQRLGVELRKLTHPTEGAVLLPLLVIAGACVDWAGLDPLGIVVVACIVVRFCVLFAFARLVQQGAYSSWKNTWNFGLTLSASGEVTCLIALEVWLDRPSVVGQMVLASAVIVSLIGELYSARAIRSLVPQHEDVDSRMGLEQSTESASISHWRGPI
jgi:hypothetical protein